MINLRLQVTQHVPGMTTSRNMLPWIAPEVIRQPHKVSHKVLWSGSGAGVTLAGGRERWVCMQVEAVGWAGWGPCSPPASYSAEMPLPLHSRPP